MDCGISTIDGGWWNNWIFSSYIMNYCGIILAKKNSKRLPNKNFLDLGKCFEEVDATSFEDKEPKTIKDEVEGHLKVFQYAEVALNSTLGHNNTFIFTDHEDYVFSYNVLSRPPAASLDDEPLWSALKWAYKSLPKRYDAIISIMANAPLFTPNDIKKAIKKFEELGCEELRSFDSNGKESGLIIVKEKYLLEKHEVSTYQGCITLDNIEIHTQEDFDKCKQILDERNLERNTRI